MQVIIREYLGFLNFIKRSIRSSHNGLVKITNILKAKWLLFQFQTYTYIFFHFVNICFVLFLFMLFFSFFSYWFESKVYLNAASFFESFTALVPWWRWYPVAVEMITKAPLRPEICSGKWASRTNEFLWHF